MKKNRQPKYCQNSPNVQTNGQIKGTQNEKQKRSISKSYQKRERKESTESSNSGDLTKTQNLEGKSKARIPDNHCTICIYTEE